MGCMLLMRQLLLLVWKNFLLQVRRPIGTVVELVFPLFALVAILGIRRIPGLADLMRTCPVTFQSTEFNFPQDYLLYAPPNNITDAVMDEVANKLSSRHNVVIMPVASQDVFVPLTLDMFPEIEDSYNYTRYGAVYFDQLEESGKDLSYTIRFPYEISWFTNYVTEDFTSLFVRTFSPYVDSGFMELQRALEESIIEYYANQTDRAVPEIDLKMKQLPFPPTAFNFFLQVLDLGLGLLVIISFLYTAATITKELVIEKETRIRESMLMMGLRQWVLWASWFIKQLLFMFVWVVAYTILFKYAGVWPRSDGFLIFIFFLLYITSIIAYGFFISVWFSSPRIALFVSFVVFFLSYIPSFFITGFDQQIPYNGKLALALFSNTAFDLRLRVISILEQSQLGLQWDNVSEPLSIDNPLNMGAVFGMLIFDILLYMIIAWYVDAVKPGTYGVPKPLYFPFLPSYWTGRPLECRKRSEDEVVERPPWYDGGAHEEEPRDREAGIKIQNLTKTYTPAIFSLLKGEKLAVDSLNLNMYEGQITALLGHNGAGKTTTISILTGLYTPTGGTAVINGYDIRSNMDQIRHSLGICPQHNVLFDRLTVLEHLKFFAILKGMQFGMIEGEVEHMLTDLEFQDKRDTIANNLSGGMKRKLSVSIALIGGSKTVVLDEPTSGMDPYARRATWDLLAKHKEGRTILLTTHFMDEADLLGDRIAIMAEGRLMCSGSSLFLKSRSSLSTQCDAYIQADYDTHTTAVTQ
ncbi:ATP-binding cassette sub-family A member 3 [Geodia barretti]|uniref:ATP-binding cassette sub-family A member 3 n=2 Tax=Geodia barretti TaxID=519541 RepID=A0AA35RGV2_GEOBA|nr:ATP-binding cassette sub-family A member 3 [Geodia barretti]